MAQTMQMHRPGHHCCRCMVVVEGSTCLLAEVHDQCHVTWSVRNPAGYINACFSSRFPLIIVYYMLYCSINFYLCLF